MLIATYQPLLENTDESKRLAKYDCFKEKLNGDAPLFCFPARTADEFRFRSLLASPRMPERLLLFDTDDFMMYDSVEWNRICGLPRGNSEFKERFDKMFTVQDIRFCECVISESRIREAAMEINLKKWTASNDDLFEDDQSNTLVRQLKIKTIEAASKGKAQASSRIMVPGGQIDGQSEDMDAIIFQNAFINFLGSIAWHCATGTRTSAIDLIPFFPSGDNKEAIAAWEHFQELRNDVFDEEDGGNHSQYLEMCHSLEKAVASERRYFLSDIGRNDRCPCGSGKKFKKCHGLKPMELFPYI